MGIVMNEYVGRMARYAFGRIELAPFEMDNCVALFGFDDPTVWSRAWAHEL